MCYVSALALRPCNAMTFNDWYVEAAAVKRDVIGILLIGKFLNRVYVVRLLPSIVMEQFVPVRWKIFL